MLKRIIDIVGALIGIIVLSPLLVLVAIAIKLDSRGPVFYRGWRMGRRLQPFRVLKFRSMTVVDSRGGAITAPGDSRITRIGAWLRLFKIDELPQMYNVLAGEMSLVGPRPEDIEIVTTYYSEEQKRVLAARPGITGPGQVMFFPDMTEEVPAGIDPHYFYVHDQLPRKLAVDLRYVEGRSIFLDLRIILQTLFCVLFKSVWILTFHTPKELERLIEKQGTNR